MSSSPSTSLRMTPFRRAAGRNPDGSFMGLLKGLIDFGRLALPEGGRVDPFPNSCQAVRAKTYGLLSCSRSVVAAMRTLHSKLYGLRQATTLQFKDQCFVASKAFLECGGLTPLSSPADERSRSITLPRGPCS